MEMEKVGSCENELGNFILNRFNFVIREEICI